MGESSNAIRKELNHHHDAGYLEKVKSNNKVEYRANVKHPLFGILQKVVLKHLGLEDLVETVLDRMGHVKQIILVGDYAKGDDFLPVPHPYNNKVMLMRTSDFNTYRPRLPMKGEGTKKRWTLKLPGTTSDNFQEYADTYRTKDQYAYYDRNLILTEIGTLNEEESKNLKEIQFLLKDLGIRDCITDYDFDPKTNKFWNKKEAI